MYYVRHRVGMGGLVFKHLCLLSQTAKGVTPVQVLRSQDCHFLINSLFWAFLRKEVVPSHKNLSWADIG